MSSLSPTGLQLARTTHLFAYSTVFGATLYQSFIGFPISYKTLPRQTFGLLQSRQFPAYFLWSSVLSLTLLFTLPHVHPHSTPIPTELKKTTTWTDIRSFINPSSIWNTLTFSNGKNTGRQGLLLAAAAISSLVNLIAVGPATTKAMFERHDLEKKTGQDAEAEHVSDEMTKLNVAFKGLHSISTMMNVGAFVALGLHGLWLSKYGLSGR